MNKDANHKLLQNEIRLERQLRLNSKLMRQLQEMGHPFFLHLTSEPVYYSDISSGTSLETHEIVIRKQGTQLWLRRYTGSSVFNSHKGNNEISIQPNGFFYEIHINTTAMQGENPIRKMMMIRQGLQQILENIQDKITPSHLDVPIVGPISHLTLLAVRLDSNIVWKTDGVLPHELIVNYVHRIQGAVSLSGGTRTVRPEELMSMLCTPSHLLCLLQDRQRR